MTKKDQYGLEFYTKTVNLSRFYVCQPKALNHSNNSQLCFLSRLMVDECKGFIYDLNVCLTHRRNMDDGFASDSVEDMSVVYDYPNVNINDILIMPMQDLKVLLEEWLAFIT